MVPRPAPPPAEPQPSPVSEAPPPPPIIAPADTYQRALLLHGQLAVGRGSDDEIGAGQQGLVAVVQHDAHAVRTALAEGACRLDEHLGEDMYEVWT